MSDSRPFFWAVFLVIITLAGGCRKDEVETRAYPVINTYDVTGITATGATLNGEILKLADGLQEMGFIYDDFNSNPVLGTALKASIPILSSSGEFHVASHDYFAKGTTYYVKAYAISNSNVTVYGKVVKFVGQSETVPDSPVITDFSPKEGKKGTIITVTGKNFSPTPARNTIALGIVITKVIRGTTTDLQVQIPDVFLAEDVLSNFIVTSDGRSTIAKDPFHILAPWKRLLDVPGNPRNQATGFSIGSLGYIGLGVKAGANAGDVWQYDPATDIWKSVKSFGANYYTSQSAFAIGNYAYVGLGYSNGSNPLSSFSKYDPATDTWSSSAWTGELSYIGSVAQAVNGNGYIISGANSGNKTIRYDPVLNSWTTKQAFAGTQRTYAASFTINSKIYVVGGSATSGTGLLNDVYIYDTAGDSWAKLGNFPGQARQQATAFSINGIGYLMGGVNAAGTYLSDFWMYTPATDTWTQLPTFPGGGRALAVSFVIGNKAYIGTGTSSLASTGYKSEFWLFDPSQL